jgi:ankyrin repeat protein
MNRLLNFYSKLIILLTVVVSILLYVPKVDATSKEINAFDQALINAAKDSNIKKLKASLDAGADVNVIDREGFTALIYAAKNNDPEILKLLLSNKADVNLRGLNDNFDDLDWTTALFAAVSEGQLKIVKILLSNGADVNQRKTHRLKRIRSNLPTIRDGETALMYATIKNDLEIMKLLILNGADVNAKSGRHYAAFRFALDLDHLEASKLLISNGLDFHDYDKYTCPLSLAAQKQNLEIIKLLLFKGASVREVQKNNIAILASPISSECNSNALEIMNFLPLFHFVWVEFLPCRKRSLKNSRKNFQNRV